MGLISSMYLYWLYHIIAGTHNCGIVISLNGAPEREQWYNIWAAGVALIGMCSGLGKIGEAKIEVGDSVFQVSVRNIAPDMLGVGNITAGATLQQLVGGMGMHVENATSSWVPRSDAGGLIQSVLLSLKISYSRRQFPPPNIFLGPRTVSTHSDSKIHIVIAPHEEEMNFSPPSTNRKPISHTSYTSKLWSLTGYTPLC